MTSPRVRWPLWLAALAMLWASLSSALARVWVEDGPGRIEICTSTGVVWVTPDGGIDGGASDDAPSTGLASIHCDWCLFSAAALGLPADANPAWGDAARVADAPTGEGGLRAADGGRWWRPALRAPPH